MTPDVGAVLLEPVLGEGGVLPLPDDYLRGGARGVRRRAASLLIADEVQSGIGPLRRLARDLALGRACPTW